MLLPSDQSSQEKFANSAATIALNNFYWHQAALVLFNSTLICSVDSFIRFYQKNVVVGRGTFYPHFVKKIRQYVIFGTDLSNIVHILDWMQKHQFDNTGTYIVVCQSGGWENCNEVDLVNILWNYKIVNVVAINNRKDKGVNGFTYYQPEDCKNTRPINVKNWDSCLLNDHQNCQNIYPLKLTNLHQCPITVSTFNQVPYMNISSGTPTGADGDLLRIIAEAMNFSLKIITPRIGRGWGTVQDNGTWTGSLADVYNEWANFSMTFPCITLIRFSNFQVSADYAVITISWVTHPSETQSSSLKLFRPFQPYVRIALGISFIMVVFFKIFLQRKILSLLRHDQNVTLPYNVVFQSWELCMGLPINVFPKNQALVCLAVFWIWYSLLMRTLYQVCLIESLQTDVNTPVFDTIEESIASDYTVGGGLPLRDYYIDDALVYDSWKPVDSAEFYPLMTKISQGLKFVLALNIETTKMFLSSNPDKKLRILPQDVITSPTAIFFKKYSPLVNPLNVILSRLRESGIIQKISLNNSGKEVSEQTQDKNIPISIVHYTGCYAILLTGWLLSCLCFVVEKVVHKIRKKD